MLIGVVIRITHPIEMIRKSVNIILGDSNLEVSKVYGQKDGRAAEENGMKLDARLESTEDTLSQHKSNSALIMVNQIPSTNTQIASVENHSYIRNQRRKGKMGMMIHAFTMEGFSNSKM